RPLVVLGGTLEIPDDHPARGLEEGRAVHDSLVGPVDEERRHRKIDIPVTASPLVERQRALTKADRVQLVTQPCSGVRGVAGGVHVALVTPGQRMHHSWMGAAAK